MKHFINLSVERWQMFCEKLFLIKEKNLEKPRKQHFSIFQQFHFGRCSVKENETN